MSAGSGPLQSSPVLITHSKQGSGMDASTAVLRDDWGSHHIFLRSRDSE